MSIEDQPRRLPWPGTALAGLALLLPVALPGCGYSAGLAPVRPGGSITRTIGIEIFGNESMLPNLERGLHAALSDAARRHTSLTLVSPERADIVIRGEVSGFERRPGARTAENRFVETRNVVSVNAVALDGTSLEPIARTSTEIGFGTAIDVPGRELEVRDNALRNTADRILLTLLAEVEYGIARPPLPEDPVQ